MPQSPRRLPMGALLTANLISQAGNGIALLAVPWYVHQTTGSATRTGVAAAAGIAAYVVGGFFGGPFADRFDRKYVSMVSDALSGLMILLIPVLDRTGYLSFPLLILLVFLSALLDSPGTAARFAVVPSVAVAARVSTERANGLIYATGSAAEVAGPMLAGLLLAVSSVSTALVIDAATYFASLVLVLFFLPRGLGRESHLDEDAVTKIDFRAGLAYIRKPTPVRAIALSNVATNFTGAPLFTVIMVAYLANRHNGGLSLGAVVAVGGIGMTVGALAYSKWSEKIPRRLGFLVGFAAFGAQYWLLAFEPPVVAVLVIFAVRGLLSSVYNPIADTVIQERVPSNLLGTVYGTMSSISITGEPLGLLVGGVLVQHFGTTTTIVCCAVIYSVMFLLLTASRSLRDLKKPEGAQAAGLARSYGAPEPDGRA
jgi:MFS family permease